MLTGTAANGTGNALANRIIGNNSANSLSGADGADTLEGGSGNDTLDGGVGADTLVGGTGNDLLIVDNAGDVVVEAAGGGADTVQASVNWTLGAELETLVLTGTAANGTGNALANRIIGNNSANSLSGADGADTLEGGSGNDTLDGGVGADTLVGGTGNDLLIVDNAGDVVVEAAGGGADTVQASVNWTLGAELETLVLTGTAANGTGNALVNRIIGNDGANSLSAMTVRTCLTAAAATTRWSAGWGPIR